ncbi:unnamed protein product [Taenia asiatica]|uniref:T-box domain-containing protein n=1 Tax=Taenia asiatica TaxID=60517 RepID=A0A0R3WGJ1_TAEAS|nr:unnamed protein product [Taenia asiatica]
MHSALLAITQGVPNVWPEDLNGEREEFSSICIAKEDFEPSNSTGNPKIILRLRNRAIFAHNLQIYLPRYHIVRHLTAEEVALRRQSGRGCGNESPACLEYVGTYVIPETEFITVSKYYNKHIANLKIDPSPYIASAKTAETL